MKHHEFYISDWEASLDIYIDNISSFSTQELFYKEIITESLSNYIQGKELNDYIVKSDPIETTVEEMKSFVYSSCFKSNKLFNEIITNKIENIKIYHREWNNKEYIFNQNNNFIAVLWETTA
jgi:hypothetical protein